MCFELDAVYLVGERLKAVEGLYPGWDARCAVGAKRRADEVASG